MATKREDIPKTMEGRDIRPSIPRAIPESGARFDAPPKRQVQVRFDPGDYEKLQRIAYGKGTKAAALIREAVKEIIKKDESGI
jgi:hypothetical protein